jgi:hypothetical protein
MDRVIGVAGLGDGWYRDDYCRAVESACAEVGAKVSMFVGEGGGELCIYFEDSPAVQAAVARAKRVCRALKRVD